MKTEQVRKIMRRIIEEILLRKKAKDATAKTAEKGIGVSSEPKTTPTPSKTEAKKPKAPTAPKATGTKKPTAKKKPKANGK